MYTEQAIELKEISKEKAQSLIIEARVFTESPQEIIAYQKCLNSMLLISYRLPFFEGCEKLEPEDLLEHVRNNIPQDVNFGLRNLR